MAGAAKVTTDHKQIKKWVEERGGHPATVKGTGDGDVGLLRIDFEDGEPDTRLEPISWDDFFEKFEEKHLAFLYQESKEGKKSRFNKLVSRETVEKDEENETRH